MASRERINLDVNLSDAASKRRLLTAIAPLQGMYALDLKPIRPTRSSQANRFYWSCVIGSFRDFLRAQGQPFTSEDCHEFLKCKFLLQSLVNHDTGEIVGRAPRSTASLDTSDFTEYVDNCIVWLADTFGIVVPDPHSYGIEQPVGAKE